MHLNKKTAYRYSMAYLISLPLQPCHIYQTLNLKSSTSNCQITQIFLKISNNLESINFTQAPKGIICKNHYPPLGLLSALTIKKQK